MKKILMAAALGAGVLVASPGSAAVMACSAGPTQDLVNDGCTSGVNDHYEDVLAAITAAKGVAPSGLTLYGKSDDNPNLFTFNPTNPDTGKSTDWTVKDGTLIKYVTVKGARMFKLYELEGDGASSGFNFNTIGLLTPNGKNQPDISHLSFWTVDPAAVPEPANWAMMIAGFGLVGSAMRRQRAVASFA